MVTEGGSKGMEFLNLCNSSVHIKMNVNTYEIKIIKETNPIVDFLLLFFGNFSLIYDEKQR